MSDAAESYIGDSVYVSHDGYQLKLRTEGLSGEHVVYIDPSVWVMLAAYHEREVRENRLLPGS